MWYCSQAQRARGKLIREIRESFTVDAFIGNATDWEKVCLGNLVGMPVLIIPTGFTKISSPPPDGSRRRTTITTGIYAPPNHDHVVRSVIRVYLLIFQLRKSSYSRRWSFVLFSICAGSRTGHGLPVSHQAPQTTSTYRWSWAKWLYRWFHIHTWLPILPGNSMFRRFCIFWFSCHDVALVPAAY